MLTRTALKTPLILLLIFIILCLVLEIGLVVYQIIAKYSMFNFQEQTITQCSTDSYQVTKLKLEKKAISVSFISAIVGALAAGAALAIVIYVGCKFRQRGK